MANIRSAEISDAGNIAALLEQLGYAASAALVENKIAMLAGSPSDLVLIAEQEGTVAGIISLHTTELFHAPGRIGRITSLVIDAGQRGSGIGQLLVDAADRFFISSGCVRAEVTSGDHRPHAHAFYEAQGYLPEERRFMKRYS